MKGLDRWPTAREWADVYDRYQVNGASIAEADWARFSNWARLDPRFAEIFCARLAQDWRALAAAGLNQALAVQVWPAALGPLLGMVALSLEREHRSAFRIWSQSAMLRIEAPHRGLFFVATRSPGSRAVLQDASETLSIYSRWGFLGREILLNKARSRMATLNRTWKRPSERKQLIDALLVRILASGLRRLTVDQYRAAMDGGVGRRQAQLDLAAHPQLRARGNTRARYFVISPARAKVRSSS